MCQNVTEVRDSAEISMEPPDKVRVTPATLCAK